MLLINRPRNELIIKKYSQRILNYFFYLRIHSSEYRFSTFQNLQML